MNGKQLSKLARDSRDGFAVTISGRDETPEEMPEEWQDKEVLERNLQNPIDASPEVMEERLKRAIEEAKKKGMPDEIAQLILQMRASRDVAGLTKVAMDLDSIIPELADLIDLLIPMMGGRGRGRVLGPGMGIGRGLGPGGGRMDGSGPRGQMGICPINDDSKSEDPDEIGDDEELSDADPGPVFPEEKLEFEDDDVEERIEDQEPPVTEEDDEDEDEDEKEAAKRPPRLGLGRGDGRRPMDGSGPRGDTDACPETDDDDDEEEEDDEDEEKDEKNTKEAQVQGPRFNGLCPNCEDAMDKVRNILRSFGLEFDEEDVYNFAAQHEMLCGPDGTWCLREDDGFESPEQRRRTIDDLADRIEGRDFSPKALDGILGDIGMGPQPWDDPRLQPSKSSSNPRFTRIAQIDEGPVEFLTGKDYPWVCEECQATIDAMAQLLREGGPDTDDPEAPLMLASDRGLLCGGNTCAKREEREREQRLISNETEELWEQYLNLVLGPGGTQGLGPTAPDAKEREDAAFQKIRDLQASNSSNFTKEAGWLDGINDSVERVNNSALDVFHPALALTNPGVWYAMNYNQMRDAWPQIREDQNLSWLQKMKARLNPEKYLREQAANPQVNPEYMPHDSWGPGSGAEGFFQALNGMNPNQAALRHQQVANQARQLGWPQRRTDASDYQADPDGVIREPNEMKRFLENARKQRLYERMISQPSYRPPNDKHWAEIQEAKRHLPPGHIGARTEAQDETKFTKLAWWLDDQPNPRAEEINDILDSFEGPPEGSEPREMSPDTELWKLTQQNRGESWEQGYDFDRNTTYWTRGPMMVRLTYTPDREKYFISVEDTSVKSGRVPSKTIEINSPIGVTQKLTQMGIELDQIPQYIVNQAKKMDPITETPGAEGLRDLWNERGIRPKEASNMPNFTKINMPQVRRAQMNTLPPEELGHEGGHAIKITTFDEQPVEDETGDIVDVDPIVLDEDLIPVEPDEYDREEGLTAAHLAAKVLSELGASQLSGRNTFVTVDVPFSYDGTQERTNAQLIGFEPDEIETVQAILDGKLPMRPEIPEELEVEGPGSGGIGDLFEGAEREQLEIGEDLDDPIFEAAAKFLGIRTAQHDPFGDVPDSDPTPEVWEDEEAFDDVLRRVFESDQDVACPYCEAGSPVNPRPLGDKLIVDCNLCGNEYKLDIPPKNDLPPGPIDEPMSPAEEFPGGEFPGDTSETGRVHDFSLKDWLLKERNASANFPPGPR